MYKKILYSCINIFKKIKECLNYNNNDYDYYSYDSDYYDYDYNYNKQKNFIKH